MKTNKSTSLYLLLGFLLAPLASAESQVYVGHINTEQRLQIYSIVNGLLTDLKIRGTRIAAGETIANIEVADNDYRLAKSEGDQKYNNATIDIYNKELSRYTKLKNSDFTSQQHIDDLNVKIAQHKAQLYSAQSEHAYAQKIAEYSVIRAKFAGQLLRVEKKVGEYVEKGDLIAELVGSEQRFIEVYLPISLAKHIRAGDTLQAKSLNEDHYQKVRVLHTMDYANPDDQTIYLRLEALEQAVTGESVLVQAEQTWNK